MWVRRWEGLQQRGLQKGPIGGGELGWILYSSGPKEKKTALETQCEHSYFLAFFTSYWEFRVVH